MSVEQTDYLRELFFRIKTLRHNLSDSILSDELSKWITDPAYVNYHISYTSYNDYGLSSLVSNDVSYFDTQFSNQINAPQTSQILQTSNTLKYKDKFIANLITNCKFIIVDQNNLSPLVTFFNKIHTGSYANELLKNCDFTKNIEVTKYHINSKHICLFHYNDKTYIAHSKIIELLEPNTCITKYTNTAQIFIKYMKNKQIMELDDDYYLGLNIETKINKIKVYHFLVKHNNFKKINSNDNKNDYGISLICVCDNKCNVINHPTHGQNSCNDNNLFLKTDPTIGPIIHMTDSITDSIIDAIPYEKKFYFSCLDELLTAVDTMNNDDILSKTIQYGGYYVKIFNDTMTQFTSCFISTEIYNYIINSLPKHTKHTNQHKIFLELYQYDKLTEILPYLHKYPVDVVKRINMSVKILAKEVLNIYHLTRKKQNCELYETLPLIYKKILYNLHKIYVNQKYGEYIIKSNDILKEKKSISVDIVYGYLKGMKNCELLELFETRKTLIGELSKIGFNFNEILSVENIDLITQTELMFQE